MISSATAGPLPTLGVRQLIATMRDFRARTLALVEDLSEEQLIGPRVPTVNPPLWEIGHVAWFAEFWLLRRLKKRTPLLKNGDALYNSTDVAHDTRWELLLPERARTLDYMSEVFDRTAEYIDGRTELSPDEFYFYLLALFHEGMHAEALAYTRQTLAYAPPKFLDTYSCGTRDTGSCAGDVEIPGGVYLIGATPDFPFVFDNEKWAHPVELESFRLSRAPVTNSEFLAFVEASGYREPRFWSTEGWRWLNTGGAPQLEKSFSKFFNKNIHEKTDLAEFESRLDHPIYWRRESNGRWQQRIYDRYVPLKDDLPMAHVSWYEAEAYCKWAGRRLPSSRSRRRIERIGARPVPPASRRMGRSLSRRKKLPLGPVKLRSSPTRARSAR